MPVSFSSTHTAAFRKKSRKCRLAFTPSRSRIALMLCSIGLVCLAVKPHIRHRRACRVRRVDIRCDRKYARCFCARRYELQIQQRILADMHALIEPQPVFRRIAARSELIPQVVSPVNAVHVDDLPNDFPTAAARPARFPPARGSPFSTSKRRVVGRGDLCAAFHRCLIPNRQRVLLQHIISIHGRNIPPRCHRNAPVARGGNAFVAHGTTLARLSAHKQTHTQNRAGRVRRSRRRWRVTLTIFGHALGFAELRPNRILRSAIRHCSASAQ